MIEVFWFEQVAGDVPANDDWLTASEQRTLCGMKVPKRRTDWRLGRWTAKHAVAAYLELSPEPTSLSTIAIRPAASGAPEVFLHDQPENVSISLSHSSGTAACAVVHAGMVVGCDLETIEPRSDLFLADYFTAEEQQIVARAIGGQRDLVATILWSAKESALKVLRTGLRLDTRAVSAWLENDSQAQSDNRAGGSSFAGWSALRVRYENEQVFEGWWRCADHLVRTVVSVPSAVPPIPLKNILAARR